MTGAVADREAFAAVLLRLRAAGGNDATLFSAIEATPRRGFVPVQWQDGEWVGPLLPGAPGGGGGGLDTPAQGVAAPAPPPRPPALLDGTGTGFTTALLARLSGRVLSLDRYRTLCTEAEQRLAALGIANAIIRQADGSAGAAADGPFDRIVAWAAFDGLPRSFVEQLASGGVMIAPVGPAEGVQTLAKLTKLGSRFEREDIGEVRLQPLARGVAATL